MKNYVITAAMITFIAALREEIQTILNDLRIDEKIHLKPGVIYRGRYFDKEILLLQSGVGPKIAERSTELLFDYFKPSLIINTGFAGALDPDLSAGSLVVASKVICEDFTSEFIIDDILIKKFEDAAKNATFKVKIGSQLTVTNVISNPHEKAYFGTKYEAIACDMEAYPIAQIAKKKGVDFGVVRAIFDTLDTPLMDFDGMIKDNGDNDLAAAVKHIIKKPKDILKLPKYQYLAMQARESISQFTKAFVTQN